MKPFLASFTIAGLAFALSAPLLAQDISVDYNHNFPFNQIKTYTWGPIHANSPTLEPRIAAAVDHVIQGYGFHESDKMKKGDIIVTAVQANSGQQLAAFYGSLNALDWHRTWGDGGFSDSARSFRQIRGNTLIVDLYDASTGKLIWRGTAAEAQQPSEKKTADDVDKSVNMMFANYPPKSGGPVPPNQQEVSPSASSTAGIVAPN